MFYFNHLFFRKNNNQGLLLLFLRANALRYLELFIECYNSVSFTLITGESCWWTIHPASKQRSEGEKVRVGDDLILVSVASERYLVI